MFQSFDLTGFGLRLSELRTDLGYSQKEVAERIGVTDRTIRNIELGTTNPRLDTLVALGNAYGVNIYQLLEAYSTSGQLLNLYKVADRLIATGDAVEIKETVDRFNRNKKTDYDLVNPKELEQITLFFKGLVRRYDNTKEAYYHGLTIMEEALQVDNDKYTIEKYRDFSYTTFELRILFMIGALKGLVRECELSNEIYDFILRKLDVSANATHQEKDIIVKCYTMISYNYFIMDDYKSSLIYAEIGIGYCRKNDIVSTLPLLLMRKAVAHYELESKEEGYDYMTQSLMLLKAFGDYDTYDVYLKVSIDKYGYKPE